MYSSYFTSFVNLTQWGRDKMAAIFLDDIFKYIFLNENVNIINISLKFVPNCPINNIPAWVQRMAWRRPVNKLSSKPMMVSLLTHISVTRPQWINKTIEFRHLVWRIVAYSCARCSFNAFNICKGIYFTNVSLKLQPAFFTLNEPKQYNV